MDGKRVAVVVSHPAHLLTVSGMLQRWQPDVLILFRAVAGSGVGQLDAVRTALRSHGLGSQITSFEISETESYRRAMAGDFAFHAAVGDRVFDWLRAVRPDVVLGDAYEAYNFHHDVARLLLDDAIQRCRVRGSGIANDEFPLSSRLDEPGAPVRYGAFLSGACRELRLSAAELTVKRELAAAVGRGDPFVAGVAPLFATPGVETYRAVPTDRDYTAPPPGLALYYDQRGREVVTAGLYPQAIGFRDHFVPLVRSLGLAPTRQAA